MKKISYTQQSYGSVFKLIKYLGYMTKETVIIEAEGVSIENNEDRAI